MSRKKPLDKYCKPYPGARGQPSTSTSTHVFHWPVDELKADKHHEDMLGDLGRHYYLFHGHTGGDKSLPKQLVKVWDESMAKMVPTRVTLSELEVDASLGPSKEVITYTKGPHNTLLATMSQVTQGHPINWDMNLPLKPRVKLLLNALGHLQQNLPIKLKHEGDVRRAAARSSTAGSSSTHGPPSVDQQLQSTMYKVFYWPAYLKSASASVKEDLQRSCCMEWSKAHVNKASGISALPSGYLMVTLGYHVHQHQHQKQEQEQEEQRQQHQLEPPIRIREMAHRLVCWSRYGPPPSDREVSHTCNNKRCLNPWHLKWETHTANLEHSLRSPTKSPHSATW